MAVARPVSRVEHPDALTGIFNGFQQCFIDAVERGLDFFGAHLDAFGRCAVKPGGQFLQGMVPAAANPADDGRHGIRQTGAVKNRALQKPVTLRRVLFRPVD